MWLEGPCCDGSSGEGGGEIGEGSVKKLAETSFYGVGQGVRYEGPGEGWQEKRLGHSLACNLAVGVRVLQVVADEEDAFGLLLGRRLSRRSMLSTSRESIVE